MSQHLSLTDSRLHYFKNLCLKVVYLKVSHKTGLLQHVEAAEEVHLSWNLLKINSKLKFLLFIYNYSLIKSIQSFCINCVTSKCLTERWRRLERKKKRSKWPTSRDSLLFWSGAEELSFLNHELEIKCFIKTLI